MTAGKDIEASPQDRGDSAESELQPESLQAQAKRHVAAREYSEAVRTCRQALLKDPAGEEVRVLLGMALLALERHDEARAEMQAVLKRNPHHAGAHRLLAEGFLRAGRPGEARAILRRTLDLEPEDPDAKALLTEAIAEEVPVVGTVDRWFDPANLATKQSESPLWTPGPDTAPGVEEEELDENDLEEQLVDEAPEATGARSPEAVPDEDAAPGDPSGPLDEDAQERDAPDPASSTAAEPDVAERDSFEPLPSPSTSVDEIIVNPSGIALLDDDASLAEDAPLAASDSSVVDELIPEAGPEDEAMSTLASGLERMAEEGLPPLAGESTVASAVEIWEPTASTADVKLSDSTGNALPVADVGERETRNLGLEQPPEQHGLPTPPPGRDEAVGAIAAQRTDPRAAPGHRIRVSLRTKLLLAAVVIVAGAIGVGTALLAVRTLLPNRAHAGVRTLLDQACISGRPGDMAAAVEEGDATLGDSETATALRARVLAMASYEQRKPYGAVVERLLSSLSDDGKITTDGRIAQAFALLANGDPTRARAALRDGDTQSGELAYVRALVELAAGKPRNATAFAKHALTESPTSPRRLALAAQIESALGDQRTALKTLSASADPTNALVQATRAQILFRTGKEGDAVRIATQVVSRADAGNNAVAESHLVRAMASLSRGSYREARSEAREALKRAPVGNERFFLQLSETFLRARDREGTLEAMRGLPETTTDATRRKRVEAELALFDGHPEHLQHILGTSLANAPRNDHQAQYFKARIAEVQGDLEAAKPLLESASKGRLQYVRSVVGLGRIAMREGRTDEAVTVLAPAYDRAPESPEVVASYVTALLAADDGRGKAEQVLAEAIRLQPNAPRLLHMRAKLLESSGKDVEAQRAWTALLQVTPSDPDAIYFHAVCSERIGDLDIAEKGYRTLLSADAADRRGHHGMFRLALGRVDLTGAAHILSQAGEAGFSESEMGLLQGQLAVDRGDGALAIDALAAIVEQHASVGGRVLLGRAAFQAERGRSAEAALKAALSEAPRDIEVLIQLARLALRNGATAKAVGRLETAERALRRNTPLDDANTDVALGRLPTRSFILRAQLKAARGRAAFDGGQFRAARSQARQALELDPRCSAAHYLLAELALEAGNDPTEHYQSAARGRAPNPEAAAQLALRSPKEEACSLAASYLTRAPEGIDAAAMRSLQAGCPD